MSSMRVGFSQLNASPRYPALPAAFMPAATDTAMKAQKPAPASHPHTRRSESGASAGANTAPSDRTHVAARNRAIQAYCDGARSGAKSGLAHVSFPPVRMASRMRAAPASPVPTAPMSTTSCRCLRKASTFPTIGAAIMNAKASQSSISFGQLCVDMTGSNLLITSAAIPAEARSLLPICNTCAVSATGMRMSTKSRNRRMSLKKMITASGSAAMSSTW